ncbi:MAG: hypothetical protein IPO37_03720 [Saprospiraceae bacterium]|nr:hypothetical protein [Saprospiraceae bacterium]
MSKVKSQINPEKIHISQINVVQSNITTGRDFLDAPKKWNNISIGIGKDLAFQEEKNACRLRLFFKCTAMNDETELDLSAEIGIEFHFMIENFIDFLKKNDDHNQVNSELLITLISIGISTSRGIILEHTKNTYFRGIILPVIDPASVLWDE